MGRAVMKCVGAPVHEQIGQRPVKGFGAERSGILGRGDDVPQRFDNGPEHDRAGHAGTENHGYPRAKAVARFFARFTELDVSIAAACEINAQSDESDGNPQIQRAELGGKGLIDGADDFFGCFGEKQHGQTDYQDADHGGPENGFFGAQVLGLLSVLRLGRHEVLLDK